MILPKLYVIIDRATLDARGMQVGAFARELAEAGVRLVQYRDKTNGPQEILRAMDDIAAAFDGTDAKLVLNDRADLAALRGWGVHVGQEDLPIAAALAVVETVGVSTHDVEQIRAADATEASYVAIGPVFATTTKKDTSAVVGLEGVRQARALTAKPLVAIGGVTLENCVDVCTAGADAVAVIGGMFVSGRTVRDVARDFLARLR